MGSAIAPRKTSEQPQSANRLVRLYQSSIGKKLITGVTGLGLAIFGLVHMLGNLTLLASPEAYNEYAYHLEQWGLLLYAIELILLTFVIFHALLGIQIYLGKLKARPVGYQTYTSTGAPSLQSLSSRTMILSGLGLGVFLVFHLMAFKFGPYYSTVLANGSAGRDLARLVLEKFQTPQYAFGYSAVMILLGLHLRHGLWSALQSLGAMSAGAKPLIYSLGTGLAIAIAAGFIGLPLAVYFGLVG
ncbi:MAG: succinate dehydrogenase cytochrome b subunit [Leptolyngbyaceae cyanobacterium SM1_1_3]|nr:succinate dehydrogenase cytochrome b subunit [Leptolyngbyaceae cyanobacterium SM1_1_3]NJN01146.1 succinate dehydrogenase cytochrome b subunit [Leptolyngbyaceae cyanobacterium RM1_1_2]NJO09274.1 succinate dehydrogenase cytochrome b subunit [Leptolyngbyaceae cyanobacterium SL_1_1]